MRSYVWCLAQALEQQVLTECAQDRAQVTGVCTDPPCGLQRDSHQLLILSSCPMTCCSSFKIEWKPVFLTKDSR